MTVVPDPPPVSYLDDRFAEARRDVHKARWWTVTFVAVAIIGVIIFLLVQDSGQQSTIRTQQQQIAEQQQQIRTQEQEIARQQVELEASCGFWSLLANLDPVTASAPAQPSQTGVTLVVDARNSYIGQDCRPVLPSPGHDLVHWARHYGLAVR